MSMIFVNSLLKDIEGKQDNIKWQLGIADMVTNWLNGQSLLGYNNKIMEAQERAFKAFFLHATSKTL